jgi:hypothetical protein
VDGLVAEAQALSSTAAEAEQSVSEAAARFGARLGGALEAGRARLAETTQKLDGLATGQDAHMDALVARVEADLADQVSFAERWMQETGGDIGAGVGAAIGGLIGPLERAKAARESVAAEMDVLQGVLTSVSGKCGPLRSGVEAVREGAHKVGLAF